MSGAEYTLNCMKINIMPINKKQRLFFREAAYNVKVANNSSLKDIGTQGVYVFHDNFRKVLRLPTPGHQFL